MGIYQIERVMGQVRWFVICRESVVPVPMIRKKGFSCKNVKCKNVKMIILRYVLSELKWLSEVVVE